MIELVYLFFILGQLKWWLYHREHTAKRDEEVWDACLNREETENG